MLKLKIHKTLLECGTDEAGRGCLAGPVTAAAVILPDDFKLPALNDSKKLTHKQREKLRPIIEEKALSYAVCHVWMDEIDKINILNASITAMQRAIAQLDPKPEFIAVDGNRFKAVDEIPHECVIKGDGRYLHIAAASVLAKTYRDDIMLELHEKFPEYAWNANKGYPTQAHRAAIKALGSTPFHRMSFKLLPEQLKLDL
ncbi:ribonuclease HII [Gilvibacter sp. SZ-19]|uniref:ribonuclease HII n=1 Tax=unclassified Gilvibacter TaxID=2625242 RepID=UPI000B3C5310|nr:ribonuclease HII [Gilvibacter sp. SZ-19]ARV13564.1 ribonuclease HII [Gilvibacter sp. SZ-19]